MKYLYMNGAEVLDGDLSTLSKATYPTLRIIYKEGDKLLYKSLVNVGVQEVTQFSSMRREGMCKLKDTILLMRKEEWEKLMDKIWNKLNTIDLLEDYDIPQNLIDVWIGKKEAPGYE